MNSSSLKGRRACVAVRIGLGSDMEDQLDSCRAFAHRHGMFLGYEQYFLNAEREFDQMIDNIIEENRSGAGYNCMLIRDFMDFSGCDSDQIAKAMIALHEADIVVMPTRLNGVEEES